ncbi:MAG: hypothetical protein U1E61_17695 [Bradyrhizobium sp.]
MQQPSDAATPRLFATALAFFAFFAFFAFAIFSAFVRATFAVFLAFFLVAPFPVFLALFMTASPRIGAATQFKVQFATIATGGMAMLAIW